MPWAATGSRGGSRRRPSAGTNTGRRWAAEASRRAAPWRRSPPRSRTGLQVTVAELAGVLAEDLTGRATDVVQWAERLFDEGAPPDPYPACAHCHEPLGARAIDAGGRRRVPLCACF